MVCDRPGARPRQPGRPVRCRGRLRHRTGRCLSRRDASFSWTCLECNGHIADRGPNGGHPDDDEPGHKPGCARLARMVAEWEAEREA
jgi:hypothetical protein